MRGADRRRSAGELRHGGAAGAACPLAARSSDGTATLSSRHDLIVIGAGPAGAAAAGTASRLGLSVLVFDEAGAAGGRIHRVPVRPGGGGSGGDREGEALRRELSASGAELAFGHRVWHAALRPASGSDDACF